MVFNDGLIVLNGDMNAPGQYTSTLTVAEIASLANSGVFEGKYIESANRDGQAGLLRQTNINDMVTLMRSDAFFYDNLCLAVVKGRGEISYNNGCISINGRINVIDGARRIAACRAMATIKGNLEQLNNRFTVMIYCVDDVSLGRLVNQFAIGKGYQTRSETLKWEFQAAHDIVDAVNNSPAADPLYAGRITTKSDAAMYAYVLADCISEYFPQKYMMSQKRGELVQYLVDFFNIAIPFYRSDFENPASSLEAGRYITTIYGTYAMSMLAAWTLSMYENARPKWEQSVLMALNQLNVHDGELSNTKHSRRVRATIVKRRLGQFVKDSLRFGDADSKTKYLEEFEKSVDNDDSIEDSFRERRKLMVRLMIRGIDESEKARGVRMDDGVDADVIAIIQDVMAKYARSYAHQIGREIRRYMDWLTVNKAVQFSGLVYSSVDAACVDDSKIIEAYFASLKDLRVTIDELIPLRERVTQRDYDRIISELIFMGFRSNEAICLPEYSLNGNVVSAYGKEVVIDDMLRDAIMKYRMNKIRYSDDENFGRSYQIDHSIALVSLNKSVPTKNASTNFRKRLAKYSEESEKKLTTDGIWRSGVYSRVTADGTLIDPITHTSIGKEERADLQLFKRIYYPAT